MQLIEQIECSAEIGYEVCHITSSWRGDDNNMLLCTLCCWSAGARPGFSTIELQTGQTMMVDRVRVLSSCLLSHAVPGPPDLLRVSHGRWLTSIDYVTFEYISAV